MPKFISEGFSWATLKWTLSTLGRMLNSMLNIFSCVCVCVCLCVCVWLYVCLCLCEFDSCLIVQIKVFYKEMYPNVSNQGSWQ